MFNDMFTDTALTIWNCHRVNKSFSSFHVCSLYYPTEANSNNSPKLSLWIYFFVSSRMIDDMDLNIAHVHLSHLRVIFTSAFTIQALDYVTDHTGMLQTPVLTFAATNRANRFVFNKKVEHWHLWGRECHFGFRSIFCIFLV